MATATPHRRPRPAPRRRRGRPRCAPSCPQVAEHVVAAIIDEVPSYTDAFSGPMGETIRNAVQLALGGFLSLASGRRGADAGTPTAPAVEGAYQLGRGEARSGRTHRGAARGVPHRRPGRPGARCRRPPSTHGVDGETLVGVRRAGLRLHRRAVGGERRRPHRRARHHRPGPAAPARAGRPPPARPARRAETVLAAAERAGWEPPTTLTAVIVPESQVRPRARLGLAPAPCRPPSRPSSTRACCCWCPDAHGHRRTALLRTLADRGCTRRAGPAVAGGAGVVRPGAAGPRRRPRARHRGAPGAAGARRRPRRARRPARPAARAARRPAPRHRREAHRDAALVAAAPGPARGRRRRPLRARRRPCATGWASCASCTATGSTTPRRCSALTVALG